MTTEQDLDTYLTDLLTKKLDAEIKGIADKLGGNVVEIHRDLDNHRLYFLGLKKQAVNYHNIEDWESHPKNPPIKNFIYIYVYDYFRRQSRISGALPRALEYDEAFRLETIDLLEVAMTKIFELDWNK
jgi:hypothetical protein